MLNKIKYFSYDFIAVLNELLLYFNPAMFPKYTPLAKSQLRTINLMMWPEQEVKEQHI